MPWIFCLVGLGALAAAVAASPNFALASAGQDYPAFVLVAGLLLVGLVADDDGLFEAAGAGLAQLAPSGLALFAGATVMIGLVTATLNLDTSVAFLTPVLVYAARKFPGRLETAEGARGHLPASHTEAPLVYGCLLLSNAGSLLLPGANLTNLIVLGKLGLGGGAFLARMWLPALAALAVTAIVVAVIERRALRGVRQRRLDRPVARPRFRAGQAVGVSAVLAATVLVLALPAPAIPVAAVGVVAAGIHLLRRRIKLSAVGDVLGVPVLVGLFGVAVALGALGRLWSGPAVLLSHLDPVGTAALAATASVVVNNLPAASLLGAKTPSHAFSLIVGLNLGPNLCVTGSLAWLLWLRAARRAGAWPSLARASLIGAVAVPLSMAAALAGLALTRMS
jgi:arsenical pump membrane protein